MEEKRSQVQDQTTKVTKLPHVVAVPTPGMGHVIPLAEFAKRLVARHGFAVTFIVPNDGSSMEPQRKVLESLDGPISSVFLPRVSFDDLPEDSAVETRIALSVTRSLGALRLSFKALAESTRVVALVVDLFGPEAFDVAKEFDVPSYVFFPGSALALCFAFHLPKLHETTSCEYRDLPEPVKFPGGVPVHGLDLIDPVQDRSHPVYQAFLRLTGRYLEADGFLFNSFVDLESNAFKALDERAYDNPPVYPVGPVVQTGSPVHSDPCLSWLDRQPNGSVLFVSFGSGGTLSHEQMTELALGLEASGARFLWVVKSPSEEASNATYFGVKSKKDPFGYLPEGFLERTKDLGLVVESWAPQVRVLGHGSTGGFLSHCGWNSTLESVVHGVPLIAWPLFAEQRMNAVLVTEQVKVAIRVKVNENGLVGREEIARCVRELMGGGDLEGNLIRRRVRELKEKASLTLSEKGSSTKALRKVAQMWMNNGQN